MLDIKQNSAQATKQPQTSHIHHSASSKHWIQLTISSDKRASRNLMENLRLYPPRPGRNRIKLQIDFIQEELEYWGLDSNQVEPCCWMTYTQVITILKDYFNSYTLAHFYKFNLSSLSEEPCVLWGLVHITDKRWKKTFTNGTIAINHKSFHSVIRYSCLTLTNFSLHKNIQVFPVRDVIYSQWSKSILNQICFHNFSAPRHSRDSRRPGQVGPGHWEAEWRGFSKEIRIRGGLLQRYHNCMPDLVRANLSQ